MGQWVSTSAGGHLRGRASRNTKPEKELRRALHSAGARFRLHPKLAPGCSPDFVLPGRRVAVWVDGCFWHGCPQHGRKTPVEGPNAALWQAKFERTRQRDRQANAIAEDLGWLPVRVWECEVFQDRDAVVTRVLGPPQS